MWRYQLKVNPWGAKFLRTLVIYVIDSYEFMFVVVFPAATVVRGEFRSHIRKPQHQSRETRHRENVEAVFEAIALVDLEQKPVSDEAGGNWQADLARHNIRYSPQTGIPLGQCYAESSL